MVALNESGRIVMAHACLLVLLCLPVAAWGSSGPAIERVSAERTGSDPARDWEYTIRFHLPSPARVVLDIYEPGNHHVRQVAAAGLLPAGDHALVWDGRDWLARRVPTEAYTFTLTATDETGQRAVWDLSDVTGGETVTVQDMAYDPQQDAFSYRLDYPARVYLRVGIKDGPLLNTLVNNEIRAQGYNTEAWDGWDASHAVLLKKHPLLEYYIEGMRLPRNTLMVGGVENGTADAEWLRSVRERPLRKRHAGSKRSGLSRHAYHERNHCRDAGLTLTVGPDTELDSDGVPLLTGPANFRVTMPEEEALAFEGQRFEVVFFLNNRMIHENEVSFLPYTWRWDPKVPATGDQYMTAEVVGYDRHFAVATLKFRTHRKGVGGQ